MTHKEPTKDSPIDKQELQKQIEACFRTKCHRKDCKVKHRAKQLDTVNRLQTLITSHEVEASAEKFIEWGYGKRCETTDLHDFPELKDDPLANRCPTCEQYERLDEYKAELKKVKEQ